MAQQKTVPAARRTLGITSGNDEKLPARPARVGAHSSAAVRPDVIAPTAAQISEVGEAEPSTVVPASSSSAAVAKLPPSPVAPLAWSSEEEAGFQALLARRKAAGYQRRGKDIGGQILRPGDIKPNPDTVVATIVGIVAERVQIGRAELIGLMASANFPHPKAQPSDKGWCQGYVAGAIRNGFLAVDGPAATVGEA